MSFPIIFNQINVNGQNRNGTVSIGENQQNGWSAHAKQNQGISYLYGLNYTMYAYSNIIDNDYVDAPITDNGTAVSGSIGQTL